MRALRRAALALGLASLAAGIVRLRGRGGKPPSTTTWQPVAVVDDPEPSETQVSVRRRADR